MYHEVEILGQFLGVHNQKNGTIIEVSGKWREFWG
jgi:hypothetical protein